MLDAFAGFIIVDTGVVAIDALGDERVHQRLALRVRSCPTRAAVDIAWQPVHTASTGAASVATIAGLVAAVAYAHASGA